MTEVKEEEDRLSLLPDCLLLEIISHLDVSTKQVIKTTSIISKRWRHLWTQLPTLVFICEHDVPNYYNTDLTNYFSFIDNTLTQYPTDFNLNKFQLVISNNSQLTKSQVYSWIQHAITRNVQEIDLLLWNSVRSTEMFSYDDELFFNNSSLISMKLSYCVFNPPNDTIRWDKLKCLYIKYGSLDEDSMGKILSGSPCLETLEFDQCDFDGCFTNTLFGNFGVERLSCNAKIYELLTDGDERFWDDLDITSMKLSRCVFSPRNGWNNLKFLCIDDYFYYRFGEGSFGKILSRSPCLETLELERCSGVRRIDLASVGVKNLVIFGYDNVREGDTLEIDAPNILTLTIKGEIDLKKILLLNTSSLVKADFDFWNSDRFEEEELLKELLTNLSHVKEITLKNYCLQAFSRLNKRGFPEVHSTSRKENILNSSHSDNSNSSDSRSHSRFYLIIILLFSVWVAMVSNLLADLNPQSHILKLFKALRFMFKQV